MLPAQGDVPRLLVVERDRWQARCLLGDPPYWIARGDPVLVFHLRLANSLLAAGWDVADAALVLAVARLSVEAGRTVTAQAFRTLCVQRRLEHAQAAALARRSQGRSRAGLSS